MKFTRCCALLCSFSLLLLSGCASFNNSEQSTTSDTSESINNGQDVIPQPQLSPFELLALELKQQPNRYLSDKSRISDTIKVQFGEGLALKKQGKFLQAQQVFSGLTEQKPGLSGPWVQLGDLSLLTKDNGDPLTRAEGFYRKAIAVNQHSYVARNRLAKTLREQGQFSQAEEQYKQALISWPGFAEAYLNLGILYDLYMGDKEKALENYQTYQALIDQPERQVKGWIADLSRQVASQKTSQIAEAK